MELFIIEENGTRRKLPCKEKLDENRLYDKREFSKKYKFSAELSGYYSPPYKSGTKEKDSISKFFKSNKSTHDEMDFAMKTWKSMSENDIILEITKKVPNETVLE
jgi:hypothetical protein